MIAEVKITMDCPEDIVDHHQFEDYLERKLKAKEVTVIKWRMGFEG